MKDPLVDDHNEISPPSERKIDLPIENPKLYLPNSISTSKYNFLTFIPKNGYEQFSKSANIYFLIIAILQSVPQISVTGGIPNILMPLLFVLTVSAIKDLLEDFKRKKSDREENSKLTARWRDGDWVKVKWYDIQVGDIVQVEKDECFPTDLVLLSSSDNKGIAYIETKNLDGETNLKHKLAIKETQSYFNNQKRFDQINGYLKCEDPNPMIYQFNGLFFIDEMMLPLANEQFLLRGSSLKNTDWITGIVVYTGHQTKIMLNSSKARSKSSRLESQMNSQIVYIFLMQLILCAICAIYYTTWFEEYKYTTDIYLKLTETATTSDFFVQFVIQFFTWMLIFIIFCKSFACDIL